MILNSNAPSLVFWPVGLGDRTFVDQLEVARAGNFEAIAMTPMRAKQLMSSGLSATDIVNLAKDYGLEIGPADGVATWVQAWRSTRGDADLRAMMTDIFDIDLHEALDIAGALGMRTIVGVGFFDEGSIPAAELVKEFASFCDLARPYDLEIALEPIPFWGIPDLSLAWQIVKAADRPNSSMTIDTWHIQKGSKDFSSDLQLLSTIEGEKLRHVQLADADLTPSAPTLAGDVMFRKFPGEGELSLAKILSIIMEKGHLCSVGPEIVNAQQFGMSNADIGIRSGKTTRQVIAAAEKMVT